MADARDAQTAGAGPLEGLHVVDFGHYYAGPMAAMLLADQGATVVRIVSPNGPELPEPQFRLLNRNKRTLVLDLKSETGRREARSLVERADVAIDSFRPGVMDRLGLAAPSFEQTNPRLVWLSLPGFASSDRERAHIPGWEGVLGAASTLYTTGIRQSLNFPPSYISVPICSAFGSMHGATAVVAALIAREKHGRGSAIEVPLVNAGLSACSRSFVFKGMGLRAAAQPGSGELPTFLKAMAIEPGDDRDAQQAKIAALGKLIPANFATHHYATSDGKRMMMMPIKPEMAARFFKALGLDAQLRREGFANESPWAEFDDGLGNNVANSWSMSRERTQRLIELVSGVIATRSAAEWEAVMVEAAVPFATLRTREEWLALPALQECGLLTRMDERTPELTVPGRLADVSGPAGTPDPRCREPRAIDAAAALAAFEADRAAPPPSPATEGLAGTGAKKSDQLAGLKVLDLCNVVAGPNAAYTLAQYGADVVRVEPPKSFNLPIHLGWTLEVNQGKRSAILDTATAPGREAFERLVRWADVVVHNRLDDVAARLGVTLEQLQAINPRVIVCQNSAFGGTHRSGWERHPGYDPMPNMASGFDVQIGSLEEPRQVPEIFADLGGGLATAFAAVLAVHQRERSGFAGEGRSSLARAANYYQLPWMIAQKGRSAWGEARGPFALGECWWQRAWACRDGWIFVGSREDRKGELARAVAGDAQADEAALERAFAERDAKDWMVTLASEDIACHPVLSMEDVVDPQRVRRVDNRAVDERADGALEILCWPDHPSGLPVVLPAPAWVQVGRERSYRRLTPAPRVGAHTREVLAELGYGPDEIDALFRLRVAHDYLPAIGDGDSYFFVQKKLEQT